MATVFPPHGIFDNKFQLFNFSEKALTKIKIILASIQMLSTSKITNAKN